jgi:uncharacterized delta-60 repeat protein
VILSFSAALKAQSPVDGFDPNANNSVLASAVQSDGKILLGGFFTTVSPNGGPAVTRNRIARLNPDGTLDVAFNPNANNGVRAIVLQNDGKILIAGHFSTLAPNGGPAVTRHNIARLNSDGTLDTSFDPNADGIIVALVLQNDGKILIGGSFKSLSPNGGALVARRRIARLNPNGTVDSFDPSLTSGPQNITTINSIALQTDGKVLLGGLFTTLKPNGGATVTRHNIARVNSTGTLDAGFNVDVETPIANTSPFVNSIAVQPDGKILLGGLFTTVSVNGGPVVTRNRVARLNKDGTLDNPFNPNANDSLERIAVQTNGKILIGGTFTNLSPNGGPAVARRAIARLNMDGTLDAFDPKAEDVQPASVSSITEGPDGKFLAGGIFSKMSPNGGATVTRNNIARLNPDGTLDKTLDDLNIPAVDGLGGYVDAVAVQPDGKILIGGHFTKVLGITRNHIARLNTNGTLDASFDPNTSNDVHSISVQPDGKILIGGQFVTVSPNGGPSVTRNCIARFNANGTLDAAFNPNANLVVWSIVTQADGKILIGGEFTTLSPNGGPAITRNRIARLNPDGTVDSVFDPNAQFDVNTIALQGDGRVVIGGGFTKLTPNGGAAVTRNRIARLNTDGTVDAAFDPNSNSEVEAIAVQADGRILVGGLFSSLKPNGGAAVTRHNMARLNSDGTVDSSFDPNPDGFVSCIVTQADRKILICGFFTSLSPNGGAAVARSHIARLNANGTVDSFNPNPSDGAQFGISVNSIAIQTDGKILIGGQFIKLSPNGGGPVTRNRFARLSNGAAAFQDLKATQNAITWTRSGASPELSRVTFEQSTNGGVSFTPLGNGTRVGATSNFTLTGLNLPAGQNILIRARGFPLAAKFSGSAAVVESVRLVFF